MRIHEYEMRTGITRTPEFERKRLACFAVNAGLKCDHDCAYCSSAAILRRHPIFKKVGENPFGQGYCIVDPATPDRVARDAARMHDRGLVQLCTLTDAWSPEAQRHNLGRRCLQALLCQPGWSVRILTKNAAVRNDFDLIAQHKDRALVGLSITATSDKQHLISILEPNASSIDDRMATLVTASLAGLRTYAMFCPLLPGIADSLEQIDGMVKFAADCHVEEVFVEPVNARGSGLQLCQEALEQHGYQNEANAIERVRHQDGWSNYVLQLIRNVQQSMRKYLDTSKLRFLLYPSRLLPEHTEQIRTDDAGVIWLGKEQSNHPTQPVSLQQ